MVESIVTVVGLRARGGSVGRVEDGNGVAAVATDSVAVSATGGSATAEGLTDDGDGEIGD
jgi:hypothetical protein